MINGRFFYPDAIIKQCIICSYDSTEEIMLIKSREIITREQ